PDLRSRPCLLYQIRRCTAPCVGLIGAEAYAEDVKSAQLYLEGRSDTALKRIEARMQEASDARRYEEAAIYRDQIQSLAKVSQRLYADTGDDVDGEELDSGELEATLTEHAKRGVRILTRPTAERRAWLEMALQNALQALKARLSEQGTQGMRLAALREGLGLPDTVQRIECFDV